ncbi:hypothetical protein [uncultured Victivallis sp.]|uniref:hypothetical protein n=1 Tax=uncultured Victivallis sp. TaxID=354118 RepID=UPI0025E446F8|nr:hypothetical protein [uncultured Victivallis sp.]
MFFLKIFVFATFFAVLAAGCASSPAPGNGIVHAPPQSDESTMARRAEELAKTLASCETRGLAFRPEMLAERHFTSPADFLALVRRFGFNRLYVYLDSPESLELPQLDALLVEAGKEGMPVEAVLPEGRYVIGRRGNFILRSFVSSGTTLEEMLEHLRKFETESEPFRFSGVTVLAEPHTFTSANIHRPKALVYAWSSDTFGPGLDNDRIMRITLDKLAAFGGKLGGIPYTVGIPDFYEELVAEGKLSAGSVRDFGGIASKVLIRNAGNKPTETVEAVRNELKAAKNGTLLVSITLAEHTSVTSGSLRRRNWADFIRSLDYAIGQWKTFPAFDGVVLGPFPRIETLYQEK